MTTLVPLLSLDFEPTTSTTLVVRLTNMQKYELTTGPQHHRDCLLLSLSKTNEALMTENEEFTAEMRWPKQIATAELEKFLKVGSHTSGNASETIDEDDVVASLTRDLKVRISYPGSRDSMPFF